MKDLVGIDIKSDYIKVVELKKVKNKLTLFRASCVETPPDSIHNNFIVDFEKISFTLSRIFREYGISGTNTALSISDRTVMAQIAKYPDMPREEMKEVIRGESEQYSHFTGKEVLVDFCNISEVTEGNLKKVNLFWVACLDETISALRKTLHFTLIIKSFNTAGFPKFLFCEPTCLAFLRSVRRNLVATANQVTVCICLNDTTTDMLALQGTDNLIFMRSLYTGRSDFEKSIKPGEDITLMNPVPSPLSSLVTELSRSLSFLVKQIPVNVNIKEVLLGGSIQYLNRINDFLTRELKINVEVHNPFDGIFVDKEFFSSVFLEQFGTSLAPALGLALREEVDNKIDVNLVPTKEPATIVLEQIKNLTVPLFILIVAIFLCVNVWLNIDISHVKRKIQSSRKENELLEEQVEKLENIKKTRLKEEEKIKSIEDFKKSTSSGLELIEILNDISKISSNSAWITKLDISNTKVVFISGVSLSYAGMSEFITALNKSAYFRDCNLVETASEIIKDKSAVRFTITGFLK